MPTLRWSRISNRLILLVPLMWCAGCAVVPSANWIALKSENASLRDENRELAARAENTERHGRNLEDQLIKAEEELALLDEQYQLNRKNLAGYQFERSRLNAQFAGMAGQAWPLTPEAKARLAEISRKYPELRFDPQTGIAKLDTDILFDMGTSELKPDAEHALAGLARLLREPGSRDLKILVAGHTDDRQVAKKPGRDIYRDNFHLSSDRALAVCETLKQLGLAEERLGVAGFGAHQPVAPNISPADRQKNRRVELFVLAPDVPVIGWTETIPNVY